MRKIFTITIVLFFLYAVQSFSQYGNFYMDNGSVRGYYGDVSDHEETVILKPPVPGIATKLFVYLSGKVSARDTIWVVGDPTDGSLPPSLWCHYINSYGAYIIDYKGTAGWYEIDLSGTSPITPQNGENGLRVGGVNAVAIQHVIKPGGPFFTIDSQKQQSYNANSFLNNVYVANPNFYNIAGTIISLAEGRYMVRLEVDYKYKDADGKPGLQPEPTLPDLTQQSKILASNGDLIASELASIADFNNDGYDDINIKNHFFKNGGDGTFENISTNVNISTNGSVWADVDNDGNLDFYAVRGGVGDRIYWGKSDGTYQESTNNNFAIDAPSVTPLFLDFDGDGLLDLFVANGRRESGGQEQYFQDKLYKNMGSRTFKDVTIESGIAKSEPSPFYDTWGASTCDYNSDGKPDIFVATYRLAPDLLYKNNGDGTFTEVGAATGIRGAQTYYDNYFGHGMGSDWGMLNSEDNDVDMIVGNLSHPDSRALSSNPSIVWLNEAAGGKFNDYTRLAMLGFYEMNSGVVLADLNNDGSNDVAHCQYAYYKKNDGRDKLSRIYLNEGSNQFSSVSLKDITWESGVRIHGAWSPLRGDFDNDGGVDLLIASSNENVKLFNNKLPRGNWISFKLRGDGVNVNRDGFGSALTILKTDGLERIARLPGTVLNARASQSSNDLHFGLSADEEVQNVKVVFQDGKTIDAGKLELNRKYIIDYNGTITPMPISKPTLLYPVNGAFVSLNSDILLNWQKVGGAVKYRFQMSENIDFSSLIANELINSESIIMNIPDNAKYYWRVAAIDELSEQSDWSDIWLLEFGTISAQLIEPSNNATNVSLNPSFKWTEVIGKYAFRIEIAYDAEFLNKEYFFEFQGPQIVTQLDHVNKQFNANTKYFWRVSVADEIDENGNTDWSNWSEVFSFTTGNGTSVNNTTQARFGIVSVSPNPVASDAVIEFELPYFANISIVVYDISANKILNVCDGYFEPGVHIVGLDASKLAQGSYIVKITDGVNIRSANINIIR